MQFSSNLSLVFEGVAITESFASEGWGKGNPSILIKIQDLKFEHSKFIYIDRYENKNVLVNTKTKCVSECLDK